MYTLDPEFVYLATQPASIQYQDSELHIWEGLDATLPTLNF